MNYQEIKNILLWQIKNSFDINNKVDLSDSESQIFTHTVSFKYKDPRLYHLSTAIVRLYGEVFKTDPGITYYNPLPEKGGLGMAESDGIEVSDWWFTSMECLIDGVMFPIQFDLDDVSHLID